MIICLLAASLAALGVSALYLWGANKGYDITDEGIYYLQIERPHDVACYPVFDFHFVHWFHKLTNGNIIVHRIAVWALHIITSCIFALSLHTVLTHLVPSTATLPYLQGYLCVTTSLWSHLRFVFGPRLLYYNNLNSFVLFIATALSIEHIYKPNPLLYAFVGLLIGFQLFIKISSALTHACAQLALVTMTLALSAPLLALQTVGYMFVGIASGMSLFFVFCRSPQKTWSAFYRQVEYGKVFGWGAGCLSRHAEELSIYFADITRPLRMHTGLVTFLVCSFLALGTEDRQMLGIALAGLLMSASTMGWQLNVPTLQQPSLHKNAPRTVGTALVIVFGITVLSLISMSHETFMQGQIQLSWITCVALGYLFFLPAIGAIGTGNPIYENFVFQLVGWQTVLFSCFAIVGVSFNMPTLLPICGAMTSIMVACIGEFTNQFKSYRLHGALFQQTVPVKFGYPGTTLYFEPATAEFFRATKEIFEQNGFQPGDDILGFFDVPGIIHALGGVSPGHQWHFARGFPDEMLEVTYLHLSHVVPDRLRQSFVIERGPLERFKNYFEKLNLSIPHDYVFAGSVFWPQSNETLSIWKPIETVKATDSISVVKQTLAKEIVLTNEPKRSELLSFLESSRYQSTYQILLEDALLRQQRFAEAGILLEHHLKKDHTNLETLLNLLTVRIAEKKVGDAISIIDQIIAIDPNIPEVHETRSFLLSQSMM
jgi:hypothetical protein